MREDLRNLRDDLRSRRRDHRHNSHGHIWTGIFILLIGVAALVKATFTDMPDWLFSWHTFLIALGVFVGIKHGFRGPGWLILIAIGGAFLLRDAYPDLPIRRYIWPSLLVIVGALMILKPKRRRWCIDDIEKKNSYSSGIETQPVADSSYDSTDDIIDSTCIFSGTKKIIISKNFKGGDLVSIFGGTELDLSQADMTRPSVIEITTIFGGTKLIIPSNWEIKSDVVNVFGGIEDKRKMQTITGNPEKILYLKGTVLFGGIEIKSF